MNLEKKADKSGESQTASYPGRSRLTQKLTLFKAVVVVIDPVCTVIVPERLGGAVDSVA